MLEDRDYMRQPELIDWLKQKMESTRNSEELTPETQKLIAEVNIYPSNTKVSNPYSMLNIKQVDPVDAINHYDQWTKTYENDITKQAK